ncbi:type I pullulanase [Dictyobacter alpinus]|uniref:type I pullulanase n=1 Tax=Dictyobacter alpinus TaxID=2014873 RepID=UPI0013867C94|nr:type I pullulanase [Dictyobacter alpinus]
MNSSEKNLPSLMNAYLDDDTTLLVALTAGIPLPYATSNVTVTDTTSGQQLEVAALKNAHSYHATVVGDLQKLLGASNNWNTEDEHTLLKEVNPNLYQYTATLPAGEYHYKIAFNNSWSDVIPHTNINLSIPADNTEVTFSYVPFDVQVQQPQVYDSINTPNAILPSAIDVTTNLLAITLATTPDVSHTLMLKLHGMSEVPIIPRKILNAERYTYNGNDLGCTLSEDGTNFRLWAPTAPDVQLLLFESETGPISQQISMQRAEQGTWLASIPNSLENWYYLYLITVQGKTHTVVDPYARALAVNASRTMIVDLAKTQPEGWENDRPVQLNNPVDAIIYELHIRDFSIHESSGMLHRGKFLAFTERTSSSPDQLSTGISSLSDLGVTHVQVLPAYEFATVDEFKEYQYNWGYDPRNYNVPEGAYATTPHGTARITEYKQMIKSLHDEQLGVVMDVVYNHTFAIMDSDFDKIVPQYYYRTDAFGQYTNGSGIGNEIASERPMVQKFIRDSLIYWMQEYHVDGFRFDLMALLGVAPMRQISQELFKQNPHVLLYGEPWTGGASALPDQQLLLKGKQQDLGIGVFNDNLRNALTGSVFSREAKGFATGDPSLVDAVERGVVGSIFDFTAHPSESINYVSSHDNFTLWDKITASNAQASESDRIKMDKLAQAIIMTSQGVPFFQGGEEFLRTKGGNDNSYNAGDAVNQFDWTRKAFHKDVFEYYRGLIRLRKNHPAFRMQTSEEIQAHLKLMDSPSGTLIFQLGPYANQDSWKQILVIYNPTTTTIPLKIPTGTWTLVGSSELISEQGIRQVSSLLEVPGISCLILYQA